MNDTTLPPEGFHPTSTPPPIPPAPPAPVAGDSGLRSGPGIRWLLLAGALVAGASVFRLVQSQWAEMAAPLQFLILVAGALALFGLGTVIRRRLRLPYAGSALLFLFAGLVPVLAWGAAYLKLLETPSGWLAFGAGGAALLAAAVHLLRTALRYRGWVYPAVLAGLLASQPILPWLAVHRPFPSDLLYAAAAAVLGALLHLGARDADRFLFALDRAEGQDRTVHLAPLFLLSLLYAGGLVLLDLRSRFVALPLAILGTVLAAAGEDHYRALVQVLGRTPPRWPRKSLALGALGLAITLAAIPVTALDPTGRALPLVAALCAALCLRWSLRHGSAPLHALGLGLALAAYESWAPLARGLSEAIRAHAAAVLHVSAGNPVIQGWKDLGFLALVAGLGAVLARRKAPARVVGTNAIVLALGLLVIAALSRDPETAPLLAASLAVAVGGILTSRRIEIAVAVPCLLAALAATPFGSVLPAAGAAGLATLALALLSRFVEPALARRTGVPRTSARQALLAPAVLIAAVVAGVAAVEMRLEGASVTAGLDFLTAGAVWAVIGYRVRNRFAFAAGGLTLSLGAHLAFVEWQGGEVTAWTAILTQAFFGLAWLLARETSGEGRLDSEMHGAARLLGFAHAALGIVWLLRALSPSGIGLTIEPLIVLFLAFDLLRDGMAGRRHELLDLGFALLVAWVPFQVLGPMPHRPWEVAVPQGLALAGAALAILIALARRAPGRSLARRFGYEVDELRGLLDVPLSALQRFWRVAGIAVCLLLLGSAPLALSLALVAVEAFARREIGDRDPEVSVPAQLALLPLLQIAVLIVDGGAERYLPWAAADSFFELFPWAAFFGLAWSAVSRLLLPKDRSLRSWSRAVEAATVYGFVAAFCVRPEALEWTNAALIAIAAGWMLQAVRGAWREGDAVDGWRTHAWMALGVLHGFTAGWLHLGSLWAPYVLLAAGAAEYAAGAWLARSERGRAFADPCRWIGLLLPAAAGANAIDRLYVAAPPAVWFWALPAFAVSLFYAVASMRERQRVLPALAQLPR